MKNCKVLMGPIAVGDHNYKEGETIELNDADAKQFASWKHVEILAEPKKESKPPTKEPA
jgi:hypothetical protein